MSHSPPVFQAGDPIRLRIHASEPVHGHPGLPRTQDVDLTGATALFVRVSDPETGVSIDLAAATIDDATGGIFGADAIPGELATLGDWKVQGRFTLSGALRSTRVGVIRAEDNLPAPP